MRKTKYQIFISSTYLDLKEERDALIQATLEIGHIPVGMEMFSAGDESQWNIIKKTIDDCDYYAVIIAHRYGSLKGETSYTEMEYDYAVSQGIPVLGFIIDDKAARSADMNNRDTDALMIEKLGLFKSKVASRMISYWTDKNDLSKSFLAALFKAESAYPRPGWVRSDQNTKLEMLETIENLRKKLSEKEEEANKNIQIERDELFSIISILKSYKYSVDGSLSHYNKTNISAFKILVSLLNHLRPQEKFNHEKVKEIIKKLSTYRVDAQKRELPDSTLESYADDFITKMTTLSIIISHPSYIIMSTIEYDIRKYSTMEEMKDGFALPF